MFSTKRFACFATLIGLGLMANQTAFAQVSSINSAIIQQRVFNDVPGAIFTGVNNYPTLISLSEQGVSSPTGFANRDLWRFSNNGTTAYQFQHDDRSVHRRRLAVREACACVSIGSAPSRLC